MVNRDTLAEALSVANVIAIEATTPLNVYVQGDTVPNHMKAPALTIVQLQSSYDATEPLLADVREQAQAAVDNNQTFLAIASPTNAQNVTQVRALTQQMTRVIRAVARLVVRERPA